MSSNENDKPDPQHPSAGETEGPSMWAFVAPFLVFMVLINFYPSFEISVDPGAETLVDSGKATTYTVLVALQVVVLSCLLFYFRKTILSQFPVRVSPLSVVVGVIGIVLWIGISELGIEQSLLESVGWAKAVARPSFNPFEQLSDPSTRYVFLAFRFCLLAVVVPIIEELFLRGWLIRYVENPAWWTVSLSAITMTGIATATGYGVLTHPGEAIAAFVWFSLVTWLMLKTGNFWDCVVAHSVTNLLLGFYILWQGAWHLW